ncbi:diphosphomevalonate decarboxylase-like [Anneissia japonica]|uniref:diphosphomevalonate decarboxylase-like n=1 Tax=Anneissia japonica TaxID=1529436 RepID=UPI0014255D9D|nr:diphosphomevalonate decarboxylase-like [Anneissia japonica]
MMEGVAFPSVTCKAPVNIAVIKYWGKRDTELVLPLNSSISFTLRTDHLCATTTAAASPTFKEDQLWLNGEKIGKTRLHACLKEIRRRARKRKSDNDKDDNVSEMLNWNVHICSKNNFPTAAGLASSAAGYACLAYSLAKLFKIEGNISDIARLGSGSASRSVFGGAVVWDMGSDSNGSDSIARQIYPHTHWPELRVVILVVSDQQKSISSFSGMQCSVETSELLQYRIKQCVPARLDALIKAIGEKDFETFAINTMKENNQFHAVCLDTYPPISYLNDTSHAIQQLAHSFNEHFKCAKVAYTFDAGPNATLYMLEDTVDLFINVVQHYFPPEVNMNEGPFVKGLPVNDIDSIDECLLEFHSVPRKPGAIKYIISTSIGSGPEVVTDPNESLLGEDGFPKDLKCSS